MHIPQGISRNREPLISLALALFWGQFLYRHTVYFFEHGGLSILLFMILETTIIALVIFRRRPLVVSDDPYEWAVAFIGTVTLPFLQPTTEVWHPTAGQWLIIAGSTLTFFAYLSLGRSFGIVAGNRGVKTDFLYRVVRHPIYASYLFVVAGYLLMYPSWYNAILVTLFLMATHVRIVAEEEMLSKDAVYGAYRDRVQWRLIPGVY